MLRIIRRHRRGRPIVIRYWTGNGVANGLCEWFPKRPGLKEFCRELLAELEAALASDDSIVRAEAQRERELTAGLRMALASDGPSDR